MCIPWTWVLYSMVITWHSNLPISKFSRWFHKCLVNVPKQYFFQNTNRYLLTSINNKLLSTLWFVQSRNLFKKLCLWLHSPVKSLVKTYIRDNSPSISLFFNLNIFDFRYVTSFGKIWRYLWRYLATTASKPCFTFYVIHLTVRGLFSMFLVLMYSAE